MRNEAGTRQTARRTSAEVIAQVAENLAQQPEVVELAKANDQQAFAEKAYVRIDEGGYPDTRELLYELSCDSRCHKSALREVYNGMVK